MAIHVINPYPKNVATLRDVANAAGVSTGTVSRALTRPELVAEATKLTIFKVIKRLHYVPDARARSLKLSRPTVIGAVIPKAGVSTFSQTIASLNDFLESQDLTLIVSQPEASSAASSGAAQRLLEKGADALILLGEQEPDVYALLKHRRVPFVLLSPINPPKGCAYVSINHLQAGHIAAQHLIKLGHRKFAFIGSYPTSNPRALARLKGVKSELKAHGLILPDTAITNEPHRIDSGKNAVKKILARHPDITAIISTSDYYALGVIRALHELKIKVPEEISVISFNNNDFSAFTTPAITTVDLKYQEVGHEAGNMIVRLLNNESINPITIEPELCLRETTSRLRSPSS